MIEDCKLVDGLLTPCETLANATSDYQGHYKKGLSIMPITRLVDGQFKTVKHFVIVKNGEYAKKGIVCNYCPFCGGKVYQADTPGSNMRSLDPDTTTGSDTSPEGSRLTSKGETE